MSGNISSNWNRCYFLNSVCYPSNSGFQCRCEDQYRWSCDQCLTYGSCDNITDGTCGCLHTIPPDGQYCQPVGQHSKCLYQIYSCFIRIYSPDTFLLFLTDFTACPPSPSPSPTSKINTTNLPTNITYKSHDTDQKWLRSSLCVSAAPPVVYEYLVTVELNTTDVIVIERLRNISYPINISNNTQVSGINISTGENYTFVFIVVSNSKRVKYE